nr:carboxypeptidase s [Quercus suber]
MIRVCVFVHHDGYRDCSVVGLPETWETASSTATEVHDNAGKRSVSASWSAGRTQTFIALRALCESMSLTPSQPPPSSNPSTPATTLKTAGRRCQIFQYIRRKSLEVSFTNRSSQGRRYSMEKSQLLPSAAPQPLDHTKSTSRKGSWLRALTLLCAGLFFWSKGFFPGFSHHLPPGHKLPVESYACAQPPALFPGTSLKLDEAYAFLSSEKFRNASILRHAGAVQLATESFDDMGAIGEDPRWEIFDAFAAYLATQFPRVHAGLTLEKVNTHGLLFTWAGSAPAQKPLVLMAHQDVVPVPAATVDAWTYPPFSGFYDGQSIWGRGSSDCKNQLIAVLESVEELLAAGFEPKRTVVLSFGFDEEISGREGAGHLAPFLLERYGKDGVAAIVDEGAAIVDMWGTTAALPGVGEKGYTDVHITVRTPGGHSSIPPDHTSIGILSQLMVAIEAEQYPIYLANESPMLSLLQCGADHSPDFPKKLRKLLDARHDSQTKTCKHKPKKLDHLALEAARLGGKDTQYLMQTSQAIDVISGGVKVNALPERVTVTVNHRINIGDTPEIVWGHLTDLAKPVAKKYNLTLHAFDGTSEAPGSISLWADNTTLPFAPITPTNVDRVTPYSVLAGTTKAVHGADVLVSPGMMTGNTDTRYYWDLTKHIFRYGPGYDPEVEGGLGNIHTGEFLRTSFLDGFDDIVVQC